MSKKNGKNGRDELSNRWVDLSKLYDLKAFDMNEEDRLKVLKELSYKVQDTKPGELGKHESITLLQEIAAIVFLLIFVGSMFWIPFAGTIFFITVRSWQTYAVVGAIWLVLALHPIERSHALVHSKINALTFRYFSLKMAWDELLPKDDTYLFICPPHGVFPYGNLLTVNAMRNVIGQDFRGITTDMALQVPVLRHLLGYMGTVDASSKTTESWLRKGCSIGISSGGVAEIFETSQADEVVLMKERKGFVKLALRTGVTIVPCYIFGNTQLFHSWHDDQGIMRNLSRKLKFGLVMLWGRFGLPICFRVPLLGVLGKAIRVPKAEGEPTKEEIDHYHAIFVKELNELFEKYKGLYGWPEKKLIIK